MADNEGQSDTVSREAFEREQRKNADLTDQLSKATGALGSYAKRDKARAALKGKVSDPDAIADLVTPHLEDVELDKIPEFLEQDRFKALFGSNAPTSTNGTPSGEGEGEGEGTPTPAQEPSSGGFGGPSPASDGTSQPLDSKEKILVGSPKYRELIAGGDETAIKKAYDDGLISSPSRPW